MHKLKQTLLAGAVALAMSGTAIAQSIIIGTPADASTGNCYPFGCSFSGEYQQVYTASAFSGPITISSLQFFNTQSDSGATSMNSGTWTIALSTTGSNWNTLSGNFADNIGANNTTVFSGDLSQAWAFENTLNISLSTAFTYNPGDGNLLMDVMVSGASSGGGFIPFDTNGFNGGDNNGNMILGRLYGDGVVDSGYGLVTGFGSAVTPVPEPETYAMLLAGLGLLGFAARRRKQKEAAAA